MLFRSSRIPSFLYCCNSLHNCCALTLFLSFIPLSHPFLRLSDISLYAKIPAQNHWQAASLLCKLAANVIYYLRSGFLYDCMAGRQPNTRISPVSLPALSEKTKKMRRVNSGLGAMNDCLKLIECISKNSLELLVAGYLTRFVFSYCLLYIIR